MTFIDASKTICLDYNGVLDMYEGYAGGKEYPPRPGIVEFLSTLRNMGYTIVIFTAVEPVKVYYWLEKYNLMQFISKVTNTKVPAVLYVDDRAITFDGNFDHAIEAISKFHPHWNTKDNKQNNT